METYVKANGYQLISWGNYIKLLRIFPDTEKQIRAAFKRGLQIVKKEKFILSDLWLEWEKKYGNI